MSVNIVYQPALRRPRSWVAVVLCAALAGGWLFTRPPRELQIEAYVWQRRDSSELRDALGRSKPLLARCHFLGVEMARDASGWRVSRSSVPDDLFEGQGLVLRLGASLAGETWEHSETIARVMELILISRSFERIADHAVNIGEDIVYMVKGEDIRHVRKF